MTKISTIIKVFVVTGLLFGAFTGYSQAGLLDAAFGNNGKVVMPSPLSNQFGLQANEVVQQPDGKLVVVASAYHELSVDDTSKFIVARYNTDGSLDASFGTGGTVVQSPNNHEGVATTLALQPDGKIIAAGSVRVLANYTDWAMVRYNTNGTVDSSFGVNGVMTISRSTYVEHIYSIVLKTDGKILAAGDASGAARTEVLQFNANGTIDSTFGLNGVATISPAMPVMKLVLQPDGKILAAEYLDGTDTMIVDRFVATGQPDSSFGVAGKAFVLFTYGRLNSMSLQPDGKMIVVGRASDLANNNTQVALARINANGSVDTTFGINGYVYSLGGIDQGYRVMVRPDGKFLVAASKDKGFSYLPPVYGNFALLKYNNDGSIDSTFGRHGVVFTDFTGTNDEAYCALVQPDGKVVMGGFTVQGGKNKIALVRYESTGLTYYNTIYATAFYDNNLDGTKDASEPYFSQANISTSKAGVDTVSIATNGKYSVEVDTGNYVTAVHPYQPYFNVVPAQHTTSNSSYFNYDTVAFALQPIAGKRDIEIELFPLGFARPGFPVQYKIFVRNNGTDTLASDTIQLIKSAKLNFNSAYPAPNSIKGDTLRWSISNFKPLDTAGIMLYLTVKAPPVVNFGDTLKSIVWLDSAAATDITPHNDTATLINISRGSYDPNNKSETHGGKITMTQVNSGDYLTYTVNFQNTGTDTAFNVSIYDTLSNRLDWSTLQMLTASANYQMTMSEGKCQWMFSGINLIDSSHNEHASHGYIVYRIKPLSNVQVGDVITNRASIYFDYNLPVQTNIDTTIVVAGVLPLRLLSFTAQKDGNVTSLHWSTVSEVNVDRFEVQRSASGREYQTMGNGKLRMENGKHEYSYIDNAPLARNYYRLKMIDRDGSFTYSPVRVISNSGGLSVSVYPNPLKDRLQAVIESDKKATLQIQIIGQDGKVVLSTMWSVNEGSSAKTINISALQSGSYFLRVGGEEQRVVKFEKL